MNDVVAKLQGLNLNADDMISNFEGLISAEEARDIKLSPGDDERAERGRAGVVAERRLDRVDHVAVADVLVPFRILAREVPRRDGERDGCAVGGTRRKASRGLGRRRRAEQPRGSAPKRQSPRRSTC